VANVNHNFCFIVRKPVVPSRLLSRSGPVQVFVKEFEGSFAVNSVGAGEPFDFTEIADFKLSLVQMTDFGKFVSDSFIGSNAVEVAPLDHERARCNQRRHFGVVEGVAQIELECFILAGPDVAVRTPG